MSRHIIYTPYLPMYCFLLFPKDLTVWLRLWLRSSSSYTILPNVRLRGYAQLSTITTTTPPHLPHLGLKQQPCSHSVYLFLYSPHCCDQICHKSNPVSDAYG